MKVLKGCDFFLSSIFFLLPSFVSNHKYLFKQYGLTISTKEMVGKDFFYQIGLFCKDLFNDIQLASSSL